MSGIRSCDVLIIGGGIAGLAAAYFAHTRGRAVTLIDAGIDQASRVPTALINPMRGYRGRVSARDSMGAAFTLDLLEKFCADGHPIAHARGVWRPTPDASTEAEWRGTLDASIAHSWHSASELPEVLAGNWHSALFLPRAGWLETAPLLCALESEARMERIEAQVEMIDPLKSVVTLGDGTRLSAGTLLWCGGAYGASRIALRARYRPGSVLTTDRRIADTALSYGIYTAPHGSSSVIGPSTEAMFASYPGALADGVAQSALIERARAMFCIDFAVRSSWRGVRLEEIELPAGLASLTCLGSRGYLLAPLLARDWAQQLP